MAQTFRYTLYEHEPGQPHAPWTAKDIRRGIAPNSVKAGSCPCDTCWNRARKALSKHIGQQLKSGELKPLGDGRYAVTVKPRKPKPVTVKPAWKPPEPSILKAIRSEWDARRNHKPGCWCAKCNTLPGARKEVAKVFPKCTRCGTIEVTQGTVCTRCQRAPVARERPRLVGVPKPPPAPRLFFYRVEYAGETVVVKVMQEGRDTPLVVETYENLTLAMESVNEALREKHADTELWELGEGVWESPRVAA